MSSSTPAAWDAVPLSGIPASPAAMDGSAVTDAPLPFGRSRELHPSAGNQQDLGGVAVAVLAGLRPAPGLELAVDVDQPALAGVLLQHLDEAVLEGHHAVPFGLVDPLAGLLADVRLVGGDAQVGDAASTGEVVDSDVGAEAADEFHAIQSEAHDRSPSWSG